MSRGNTRLLLRYLSKSIQDSCSSVCWLESNLVIYGLFSVAREVDRVSIYVPGVVKHTCTCTQHTGTRNNCFSLLRKIMRVFMGCLIK